ncbi:serine hydrolase domain-containing protein [Larkinella knui]|uniref:Class A beta-lactamase-related serine hydrolase n=1 Tax=Larkinella knui TaxID=2025310 RepID=A0A3P1CK15_9BACT|nr:serine hydrolase domain-containing protein [Larkinella knui]RRB13657.1 class A beta-lactamase-related serine hydrolase [Larkinella knui]
MKKQLIISAFMALFLSACETEPIPGPAAEPGSTDEYAGHPQNQIYRKELQAFRRKWNIPGTIMLLKRGDDPVWIGADGKSNLEYQTDLRINDSFRTGSITKVFVATVIMQMKEKGQLRLEDNLAAVLPEVVGHIPDAHKITIRHLLAHTSGIADPTNDDLQYQLDLLNNPSRRVEKSTDELLRRYVYGRALVFQPGDQFGYSNTNFWLLGKLIEKIRGKRLPAVLEEVILTPFGLTHTYLDRRDDRNVVRGYNDFYANGNLMDVTAIDRADSDGQANGGLISTAEDLLKFSEAFFGGKIIGRASVQEMMTIQPVRKGTNEYGLGLESYSSPELGMGWGHNGTLLGVDTNWFHFPDAKATYIIFNNNGGGADKSFVEKLLK